MTVRPSSPPAPCSRSTRLSRRLVHVLMLRMPASRATSILAGLLLLGGCSLGRTARPAASDTVRVVVYNIHAGKDAAQIDNLERVAAVVMGSSADVVLLQEVDRMTERSGGVDQAAVLARLTKMHATFGKSLDYQGGEYGIAILSRWPVALSRTANLPVSPPQQRAGGSREPRVALLAVIDRPAGRLLVINTHLDASRDDNYRMQEIRTVRALADSVRAASAGTAWIMVGGDLNATPESDVQKQLLAHGWRDAWLLCGRGNEMTYPADSGVKRIDYLYLAPALGCATAEVIDTRASDHRPLLVRVVASDTRDGVVGKRP